MDISKTTLFSADDICTRLSISKSTLDRYRKITNGPSPSGLKGGFQTQVLSALRSPADAENDAIGLTPFPAPTLHVGGSPRWDAAVVNAWLSQNADKKNKRGFR